MREPLFWFDYVQLAGFGAVLLIGFVLAVISVVGTVQDWQIRRQFEREKAIQFNRMLHFLALVRRRLN